MTLLRRRSLLPQKTQQVCYMGYGEEDDSTLLEIVYEYNREKIDRGDGYGQVCCCFLLRRPPLVVQPVLSSFSFVVPLCVVA